MPKIEVYRDALMRCIGRSMSDDELEELLPCAKAELDEPADAEGIMKIELNDTNRPDLWSTAGLARQLRTYLGGAVSDYPFFSRRGDLRDSADRRVVVDAALESIRPFLVGFAVTGRAIDEPMLKDIIQTQEKLTWNYGRKRKSISMGVYRTDLIEYPVLYRAVNPDTTTFQPLQSEEVMSMREMLSRHPKGVEFGAIVADFPRFPLLTDARGEVLSFPPVINSAHIGAVEVGDENLFIELTGIDMNSLLVTASIVACDLADTGFTILPVTVEYPYDTPYGRSLTAPYYFQERCSVELQEVQSLLGEDLSVGDVQAALERMGIAATVHDTTVTVDPPHVRNDFMHGVDVVEDVMIGRGMESFTPEMPRDFTVGRLSPVEAYSRRLKSVLVGAGFQEMIFNYLGSGRDYIERNYPESEWAEQYTRSIQIANPMSENYEFVRPSTIPSLLASEAVSGNAAYPHNMFEIGKIGLRDDRDVTGTGTFTALGMVSADTDAGFNEMNSYVSAILYYIGLDFELIEAEDGRFIPGRVAAVVPVGGGAEYGRFGELHPRVLEQWGIQMPMSAAEFLLERMMKDGR